MAATLQRNNMKSYTYNTYPKTVYYRMEDSAKPTHGNVMYDKRVVRGNTWALRRMAQEQLNAEAIADRNEMRKRRNMVRQQVETKLKNSKSPLLNHQLPDKKHVAKRQQKRPTDSSSIDKLDNGGMDTTGNDVTHEKIKEINASPAELESTTEHVEMEEADTQTEGTERSTVAETQADEEFDEMLEPVLEMLIETVIEEAMREVSDEEELRRLRKEQRALARARVQDLARIEQLEEHVKSAAAEKGLLVAEFERLKEEDLKLASRQVASDLVRDLIPDSIERLSSAGYLDAKKSVAIDTTEMQKEMEVNKKIQNEVFHDFMPWIYGAVSRTVQHEHMQSLLYDAFHCVNIECRTSARAALQKHVKHFSS